MRNLKTLLTISITIILFGILYFFFKKESNQVHVIKTNIIELKVLATEIQCQQGFCNQTFKYKDSSITLKNQSNFNKILKGKDYYLYYLIDARQEHYNHCVLSISEEPRDKNRLNQQYTNKSLFSVACLKKEQFFKEEK